MALSKFTLTIKMGNDAMRTRADVRRALGTVAQHLPHDDAGRIRDANGNTVGEWYFLNAEEEGDDT